MSTESEPCNSNHWSLPSLAESDWQVLRQLIHDTIGIRLSEAKRVFLASRLSRRVRATGCTSLADYCRYVLSPEGQQNELECLINAVTTNKTDFFREVEHFTLLERLLQSPSKDMAKALARGLKVWCAASSTGEEPYSIAALLQATLSPQDFAFTEIWASDIDTQVLSFARTAIYPETAVIPVGSPWLDRMFVRGKGEYRNRYRIKTSLRAKVQFSRFNLATPQWEHKHNFDLIFCRNVLIYFDRPVQERVVGQALEHLTPGGLLFLGHSESLNGFNLACAEPISHAVYCKKSPPFQDNSSKNAVAPGERGKTHRAQKSLSTQPGLRLHLERGGVLAFGREGSRHFTFKRLTAMTLKEVERACTTWQRYGISTKREPATTRYWLKCLAVVSPEEPYELTEQSLGSLCAELGFELRALRVTSPPLEIQLEPEKGRIVFSAPPPPDISPQP